LLGIICCDNEEQHLNEFKGETFVGTFQREVAWAICDTAKISITFSSGIWSGESNKVNYPALCKGTYSIKGDTIIFKNECMWTADFDWSLILSGKYVLKTMGDSIEFYRDYHSATYGIRVDRYKLKRQSE